MRNCQRWLETELDDIQTNSGCWEDVWLALAFSYWIGAMIWYHHWLLGLTLVAVVLTKKIWRKWRGLRDWHLFERRVRRIEPTVDSIFTIHQESTDLLLTDQTGERCYMRVEDATPTDAFRLMNLGRRLTTLYRSNVEELEQYPHFQLREDDPLLVDAGRGRYRSLLSPVLYLDLIGDNAAYMKAKQEQEQEEAEAAARAERFRQQRERELAEAAAAFAALAEATAAANSPVNLDAPEGALSRLPGSSDDPTQVSISPT